MAYFAELDASNIVVRVLSIPDELEHRGAEYLSNELQLGGRWERTSYGTRGGVHYDVATNLPDGKSQFRKNFAGVGYQYDSARDAFIPPSPYPSWILNEGTCLWESPVPYPTDSKDYGWDESTRSWILLDVLMKI